MPTIIVTHMMNVRANSTPLQGSCAGIIIIDSPVTAIRIPVMSMPPMSMSAASMST